MCSRHNAFYILTNTIGYRTTNSIFMVKLIMLIDSLYIVMGFRNGTAIISFLLQLVPSYLGLDPLAEPWPYAGSHPVFLKLVDNLYT